MSSFIFWPLVGLGILAASTLIGIVVGKVLNAADTPTPEPPADTLDDELRALIAQHREEA